MSKCKFTLIIDKYHFPVPVICHIFRIHRHKNAGRYCIANFHFAEELLLNFSINDYYNVT